MLGLNNPAWAGSHRSDRVDRIIIKYKESEESSGQKKIQANRQRSILKHAKGELRQAMRKTGNNADIYYLDKPRSSAEARLIAQELMRRDDVEYAEPDYRRYPAMVPNDPLYLLKQWYLQRPVIEAGAINAEEAWDDTTGDASIVIAVVDTGILQHQDIAGGRVLSGYDFVSNVIQANDGDGRDSDPTDPGDFVTTVESNAPGVLNDCEVQDSSWHGTLVSGMLIATADTQGIAGLDHKASLLPLRALGKCGGLTSDIADAIRWAAGLPVANPLTLNPDPADVINLSLGSEDPCTATEQAAIDAAVAAGVVVVAATGNEGLARIGSPASCNNVIAVAATSRQGAETCYTNVASNVDISAPGGNDSAGSCNGSDFIVSTGNDGTTVATSDNYTDNLMGTSFAAPLVSGAVALLKAIDADLSPDAIEGVLETTARAFPTNTNDGFRDCVTTRCGAGILDVHGAVRMAITGVDAIANPFRFTDRSGVNTSTVIVSNSVKISGINISMPVRISGNGEYSIDGGGFTDDEGTIEPNQSIRVRLRSSSAHNARVETRLSIGEVRDTFTVTTKGGGGGGGGEAAWLLPLLIAWQLRRRP